MKINVAALFALLFVSIASRVDAAENHGHAHDHDHHGHSHNHHGHSHEEPSSTAAAPVNTTADVQPDHPIIPADLLKRLEFVETFQDGQKALETRWIASKNERYAGSEWIVASMFGVKEGDSSDKHEPGFKDEKSLGVNVKHHKYGLTHLLSEPFDNTEKTLVFQYEVRLHDGFGCSGAYVKLLLQSDDFDPAALEESSPYVVMFGPDRCGSTNKVHFIVRQKLPGGKWEEKHMAKIIPAKSSDFHSHLYTLIIRPDNSFSVLVDNVEEAAGSLTSQTDFAPPFGAPKEIDDPNDKKPADWVDVKEIPDPKATKPEDWDEDAPKTIPDPDAKRPEDWDDDDDGEWQPPQIPNPEFKGKWAAPIIPNPAYQGEWKPKKIPNPDFFVDEHPSNLQPIGAIAFEILANERGIAFDNIVLTHDEAAAKEFSKLTFDKKSVLEKAREETLRKQREKEERLRGLEEGGPLGRINYFWGEFRDFVSENLLPFVVSLCVLLATCIYFCCWMSPSDSRNMPNQSEKPAADDEDEDEDDDEDEDEDIKKAAAAKAEDEPKPATSDAKKN